MSLRSARICLSLFTFVAILAGWMLNTAPRAHAESTCNQLVPLIKDDRVSPAQWVDPTSISFALDSAAQTEIPQQLGPIPAGTAYLIGATQVANVPWLGVNTMHPQLLENTVGDVTWELTGFEGPGAMYVFTQGNMGQVVGQEWFSAANGSASGSTVVARNSHVHPNWVFSDPGTYHVQLTQTAELTSGETVSGTSTLTFEVSTGAGTATEGHFDFGAMIGCSGDVANPSDEAPQQGGNTFAASNSGTTGGTNTGTRQSGGSEANNSGATSDAAASQPNAQRSHQGTQPQSTTAAATTGGKTLPNTGPTVMTLPIAFLAFGVLVLGGGLIFAARYYRLF